MIDRIKNYLKPLLQTRFFHYVLWLFAVALWSTLLFALSDFLDNPIEGPKSIAMITAYLVVLFIVVLPLMLVATINRYVCCIFLPLYGILGAIVAYYRVFFHATVTVVIIDAVFNTSMGEASGVITPGLFGYIFLNIALAAIFVWLRFRIGSFKREWMWMLVGVLGAVVCYAGNQRIQDSIVQRYPYNIYYNGIDYYHFRVSESQPREQMPAKEIAASPDTLTVVLVLGESVRTDHLSINGYERNTTPRLKNRENVISMGDVWSRYTNTTSSITYIMTPANEEHTDWRNTKESLIPYYKQKDFKVSWISNQDVSRSYSHFINSCDTVNIINKSNSVYTFNSWVDLDLLEPVKESISQNIPKKLLIVHTIGAHWYYDLHYTDEFKQFTPVTTSRVVTDNDPEEIINSYDNCILVMDYVLDSIASMLQDQPAVILYQSDHGEGLGENGAWLHAYDEDIMHHPAGFVWFSEKYRQQNPETTAFIEALAKQSKDTSYVFPFMLRLIGLALQ